MKKETADKLKVLINKFSDSQSMYDGSVSRSENGDPSLCYEEMTYNKTVLYEFIEGLIND